MKTIKVFLASSEELEQERLQFDSLFNHLNRIFRPRGIYLELSKWEYLDSSMGPKHKQQEYNEELKTCDICLALYWTRFGEYTAEELMTAYNELMEGRNPQKLYVFFKEPGDVTPELQAFKDSFATEFGHFYCKFENVDSMRLHFLLQLEAYQNTSMKDIVKVEDSKVKLDGNEIANLDNVPFAAKNNEYQRLKAEVAKIQAEIDKLEDVIKLTPNSTLDELLGEKRTDLFNAKEELSKHEKILFDTTSFVTKQQSGKVSERMALSMAAFEEGKASEANSILNEVQNDAKRYIREISGSETIALKQEEELEMLISELLLKASIVMSDDTIGIDERIDSACEVYRDAYLLANKFGCNDASYVELLDKYLEFLKKYARYEEALAIGRELLNVRLEKFGEHDLKLAKCYIDLSEVCYMQEDYPCAMKYLDEALGIKCPILGCSHPEIAEIYNNYGVIQNNLGNHSEALTLHEKALDIRVSLLGKSHLDVAESYNNLALVYMGLSEPFKALQYMQRVEDIAVLKGEKFRRMTTYYNNIASLYRETGEYEKALDYHDKSLQIGLSIYGERHPKIAINYNNIGMVHMSLGNYESALELFEKSLKISLSIFGEDHTDVALAYNNISQVYNEKGDSDKALELCEKSLGIYLSIHGENHSDVARAYGNIGGIYINMGENDEALWYLNKSLGIYTNVFGEDNLNVCEVYEAMANAVDDPAVALTYFEKSLSIRLKLKTEQNMEDLALCYMNVGFVNESMGDIQSALESYREALCVALPALGKDNPELACIYNQMAHVYHLQGKHTMVLKNYRNSLNVLLPVYDEKLSEVDEVYFNMGCEYYHMGNLADALECAEKSLSIRLELYGEDAQETQVIIDNIEMIRREM